MKRQPGTHIYFEDFFTLRIFHALNLSTKEQNLQHLPPPPPPHPISYQAAEKEKEKKTRMRSFTFSNIGKVTREGGALYTHNSVCV